MTSNGQEPASFFERFLGVGLRPLANAERALLYYSTKSFALRSTQYEVAYTGIDDPLPEPARQWMRRSFLCAIGNGSWYRRHAPVARIF